MKILSKLFTLAMVFISMVSCRANQQMPDPTSNPSSTPLPAISPSPTRKPTRTPRPTPTPIQYNKPWEVINQTLYSHNLYLAGFLSDVYGITVGDSGEVHYTNDGGQDWPKAKNLSMCRFGLDIVDEQIAWNCGNGASVLVTTDGGKVWTPVTPFGGNEPDHCRFLRFLDGTTGWAATPTKLGITNDSGQTWTVISTPPEIGKIYAIDLRSPVDGYLVDSAGILYKTADGGNTWTAQSLNLNEDEKYTTSSYTPVAAIRFTNANLGMIAFSMHNNNILVLHTSDGGITWQREYLPIKNESSLYLANDGKTLTITDAFDREITVLRYQE
jgi:photosystem II stability/assembly factor-like uncharacterized protein